MLRLFSPQGRFSLGSSFLKLPKREKNPNSQEPLRKLRRRILSLSLAFSGIRIFFFRSSYDSEDDDSSAPPPRERYPLPNSSGKFTDFCVRSLSGAAFGRSEISLAEREMPGLMALRTRGAKDAPLTGAKVAACGHINAMTAVMLETMVALGAQVRIKPVIEPR